MHLSAIFKCDQQLAIAFMSYIKAFVCMKHYEIAVIDH